MAEVRVRLDDDFIRDLQIRLGQNIKPTDILREALTLFNWAVDQRAQGNVILAGSEDGDGRYILAQHVLDRVPLRPKGRPATAEVGSSPASTPAAAG